MKKPFTLLAVREARKSWRLSRPLTAAFTIIFAEQRRCSAEGEATAESWGQLSFEIRRRRAGSGLAIRLTELWSVPVAQRVRGRLRPAATVYPCRMARVSCLSRFRSYCPDRPAIGYPRCPPAVRRRVLYRAATSGRSRARNAARARQI